MTQNKLPNNGSTRFDIKWFLITLTFVISVFYIIPFELYFNAKEYWNWNIRLPVNFALIGTIVFVSLIGCIKIIGKISDGIARFFSIFLFSCGVFVLLADIFSPLQTNLMDGTELMSPEPLFYSIIECLLLGLVIVLTIKAGNRWIVKIGGPITIILALISVIYLIIILNSRRDDAHITNQQIGNSMVSGNVYHIVLDEFQSDILNIFLNDMDAHRHFSGFTFYPYNVSNYIYTSASFPSYMTGTIYSDGSFREWQDSFHEVGALKKAYQKGYQVILYSARQKWCGPYAAKCTTLDDIYDQYSGVSNSQFIDFIQIWFARILPNFLTNEALAFGKKLGKCLYRSGTDLETIPLSISEGKEPFSSFNMLKELTRTEASRPPNGFYLYAHAILPHGPYVMTEDGEYDSNLRKQGVTGYYQQVKCATNLVIEFLNELKRLGRYNQSTIIIHADTGHGHLGFIRKKGATLVGSTDDNVGTQNVPFLNNALGWTKNQMLSRLLALLLIKPPNAVNPLSLSEKQTQLVDLYPSIMDLLNIDISKAHLSGMSIFDEEFSNDRLPQFFLYPPGDENPAMIKITVAHQNRIQNSAIQIEGMSKLVGSESGGIRVDIGSNNEGGIRLEGFFPKESAPDKSVHWRWAGANPSRVIFTGVLFPEEKSLKFSFRVKPLTNRVCEELILKTALSRVRVKLKKDWGEYQVKLRFPANQEPQVKVVYEKAVSPESLGLNKDKRKLSVAWNQVSLERIK